jgi:hypothetical protein
MRNQIDVNRARVYLQAKARGRRASIAKVEIWLAILAGWSREQARAAMVVPVNCQNIQDEHPRAFACCLLVQSGSCYPLRSDAEVLAYIAGWPRQRAEEALTMTGLSGYAELRTIRRPRR